MTSSLLTSDRLASTPQCFQKWQPSALMEWAKSGYASGGCNLARSGVPSIAGLDLLPGGPFNPDLWGHNEWGHEGLKSLLAQWYGVQPENVLLAQGASQSNFLIAGAALADGGTAIVEAPAYEPVLRGIQVWADQIVRLPRRRENRYRPDPADLRARLTPDTRLVWLTNLHNPTHGLISAADMTELVAIAAEVGAIVVVDEVFLAMIDRDHRRHGHASGAVSVNSLDKSWGLDSLRVGWAVGPAGLVHRAYRLNNLLGVNQPYVTEDLAWRVLQSPQAVEYMTAHADAAARGRALFDEFLAQTPQVSCVLPPGGICALVDLPAGTDDRAFCRRLVEQHSTTVFPGSLFGCPGSIRVSFGGPQAEVAEGLRRLRQLILESA